MTAKNLKGSIVALITPFHEDGTVNFEKLAQLVDFRLENGTDGGLRICDQAGGRPGAGDRGQRLQLHPDHVGEEPEL